MERRITEEQLTKALLLWLEAHGWIIICFDFPQSGTGIALHRNKQSGSSKNKGSFIPDIVVIKNETVLFFENKDKSRRRTDRKTGTPARQHPSHRSERYPSSRRPKTAKPRP